MTSFVEFDVQPPPQPLGAAAEKLARAEALIRKKNYLEATPLLKPLAKSNGLARRLLLECYVNLDRTRELSEEFYPPQADSEIIYVADALWAEKKGEFLQRMLESDIVLKSSNHAVAEVAQKYMERLKR